MQRIDETSSDMQRDLLQRVVRIPPKQREMLSELLEEYERKGNFVRIYPTKCSDMFDCFFQSNRFINKMIYRYLYTDELFPNNGQEIPPTLDPSSSNWGHYEIMESVSLQHRLSEKKRSEPSHIAIVDQRSPDHPAPSAQPLREEKAISSGRTPGPPAGRALSPLPKRDETPTTPKPAY